MWTVMPGYFPKTSK